MTSNIFMFPTIERMKQVHAERCATGTDALSRYFIISSEDIVVGDQPMTDVADLDIEREKRNS